MLADQPNEGGHTAQAVPPKIELPGNLAYNWMQWKQVLRALVTRLNEQTDGLRYSAKRNETKQDGEKFITHGRVTSVNGTKNYSLPRKLSSPVSQNTNGGQLVIGKTRFANYFYKRSALYS